MVRQLYRTNQPHESHRSIVRIHYLATPTNILQWSIRIELCTFTPPLVEEDASIGDIAPLKGKVSALRERHRSPFFLYNETTRHCGGGKQRGQETVMDLWILSDAR
ncbi:hypothetical protein Trydic_g18004 [Trypoxylus dichotomus]